MRNDAIDVKVNKGLWAFWTEEECAAGGVVHEEVFGEDGGAGGCPFPPAPGARRSGPGPEGRRRCGRQGASSSVKHYFLITFPRRNFNALIINDLYFAR